jgi:squalene-hopene/tetraprenyl-beta-curcumene cyclase
MAARGDGPVSASPVARARAAAGRAEAHLYDRQRADGGWTDRLSSSAVATGLAVVALAAAGRDAHGRRIDDGLAWLRRSQRADGGWSDADGDPPASRSGTAFAMAAFQAARAADAEERLAGGRRFLAAAGGADLIPGMRGPGPRTWPAAAAVVWALVGLRELERQPRQPVEVMLLPPRLRSMVSIALPGVLALGVMQSRLLPAGRVRRALAALAEPRALAWLRSVQAPDGGIEECPMLVALVLLGLELAGVAEDVRRRCAAYLAATQRPDGSWAVDRDLEVAVTAYAVLALAEGGDVAAEAKLRPTREWLLSTQWREPFRPLGLPAGGWAWAVPSGWPESDDTACVLSALRLLGLHGGHPAAVAGLRWLLARQNRDGSWSEWVRDSPILNDRPCPAVTAQAVQALHLYGVGAPAVARGLRAMAAAQRPDGALASIWFRGHVHGTARVLEARAGVGGSVSAAARWLLGEQRADGAWPARGETVEETAWALFALLAAGLPPGDERAVRAVRWLVERQRPDGTWRASPVGLYFDDLRYSSDLVCHTYALRALGRWLRGVDGAACGRRAG